MAGATVTNNQATFATSGPYVNLPSGLFGSYKAVSVEAWVTTGVNSNYARIFEFGTSSSSDRNAIIVAKANGFFWMGSHDSAGVESSFTIPSAVLFDSQTDLHLVVTLSAGDYARYYVNGTLLGIASAVVSSIPPPDVFYIGKSLSLEPGLIGSVNEFRIWGGALSATDIATRYSHGPGEA